MKRFLKRNAFQITFTVFSMLLIPVTMLLLQQRVNLQTEATGEGFLSREAELANISGAVVVRSNDTTASNNKYLEFGVSAPTPTTSPTNNLTPRPIVQQKTGHTTGDGIWISRSEL